MSLKKDVADVVLNHIVGPMLSKPDLKQLLLEEPTADSVLVRHPSGRPVEIKVVAGSRAGSTLLGRWSAGVIFDEAPRMQGQDSGAVVNLTEMQAAIGGRLLKGARIWYVGSPYQPYGPIYDMVNNQWGKANATVLVIKAPAWVMNPITWTPEVVAEFRERQPDAARTDVDAEFADPESALFAQDSLYQSTRTRPPQLPYNPELQYVAAMDPATRGNAWTLVIATRDVGKIKIAYATEWKGSRTNPLNPREVMREVAEVLRLYGLGWAKTDQWASDFIIQLGNEYGVAMVQDNWTTESRTRSFIALARRIEAGLVELPPNEHMRLDLLGVRRRITHAGVTIVLPQTADGRHGDYVPSLAMACAQYLIEAIPVPEVATDMDPEEALETAAFEREQRSMLDTGVVGDEFDELEEYGEPW